MFPIFVPISVPISNISSHHLPMFCHVASKPASNSVQLLEELKSQRDAAQDELREIAAWYSKRPLFLVMGKP